MRSILAAPLVLVAFAAAPAAAQYYPGPPPGYVGPEFRVIPEPEIVSVLRSLGFTPIGRPRLQGRLWIVRAVDEDEIPMRVVLDASTGEVIDAIAIAPGTPPSARRYGMRPNDLDEPEYPLPPAAHPYPRQNGPRVIYRDRDDFYDDNLPPPPAGIGPRSNVDGPRGNQARREPAQEKRATVPTPRPKPSEIAAGGKDPTVTGSVPATNQPLPPVNPLE